MSGVVGRPDPRLGEEVVAFVQLRIGGTVTAEELMTWARDRVGRVKYPREVTFVDSIPVTSVLKLDRKALRARLRD
jgi:long-chain acyl-CoA synthetase